MAIKTILTEPNTLLRQISQPVEQVGESEKELMNDMLETMYAANGIGLAAIQIGVPKRIIVMDLSKEENKKLPMYFVNLDGRTEFATTYRVAEFLETRGVMLPATGARHLDPSYMHGAAIRVDAQKQHRS